MRFSCQPRQDFLLRQGDPFEVVNIPAQSENAFDRLLIRLLENVVLHGVHFEFEKIEDGGVIIDNGIENGVKQEIGPARKQAVVFAGFGVQPFKNRMLVEMNGDYAVAGQKQVNLADFQPFFLNTTAVRSGTRGFCPLIRPCHAAGTRLRPISSADCAWCTTTTTRRSPSQVREAEIASAPGPASSVRRPVRQFAF